MRVSSDPKDPDWRVDFPSLHITVDGDQLRDVVFADDEAGVVACRRHNSVGQPARTGHVVYKGKVVIRRRRRREERVG